jgi:hypothetical protein
LRGSARSRWHPGASPARARITGAVDALARALETSEPLETVAALDVAVIAAILEATGSAVLQLCTNPIAAILAGAPRLRDAIYADADQSVLAWRALLTWLDAPDDAGLELVLAAMEARDALTLARLAPPALSTASAGPRSPRRKPR